ncbi:MAG: DUF4870 domain-containing protein [Bacteroidota bacterium]
METPTYSTGPYDADFDDPRFDTFGEPDQDERTWGLIAHLSALSGFVIPFGNILGPLVVWLTKRDQSAFVADQAKEALNFQITLSIAVVLGVVLIFVLIGIPILMILGLAALVMPIIAGIRANEGRRYRYPLTLRLVS